MIVRVIPAGDIALVNGSYVIETGAAYTRTRLAARLKFFKGEYFLDRRKGVPYYDHVFVKNPNIDVVRTLFRRVILGTPGVLSLRGTPDVQIEYNPAIRMAAVGFHAMVEGGEVRVALNDPDFIVSLQAA